MVNGIPKAIKEKVKVEMSILTVRSTRAGGLGTSQTDEAGLSMPMI